MIRRRHLTVLILTLASFWLVGCDALAGLSPSPTPIPTATPTLTPTPRPALLREHIWVMVEGQERSVLAVSPQGVVETVALPLNEGQRAPEVIASRDGRTLAYQVWDSENHQQGIAAWTLVEPNARLVTQPLAGYRIVYTYMADDSSLLYTVEVQDGTLPVQADWRLSSVPVAGGQPTLLASMVTHPYILPPRPFGVMLDGRLLLNAVLREAPASDSVRQGLFALAPATGELTLISPQSDRVIADGALSLDGTQIAYTTYQGPLPGEPGSEATVLVGRVLDLATGETITLADPSGADIDSLRWLPDSLRLLLDVVPRTTSGRSEQTWALAVVGGETVWPRTAQEPTRAALFTYTPFGQGVAYTLFPASGETVLYLYLLPAIDPAATVQSIALGPVPEGGGAARIIYAP